MARYDCSMTLDGWGEWPPIWPALVFDAEGVEILDVIRLDTETGWCEVYATDAADNLLVADGEFVKLWKTFPAPLRLEPIPSRPTPAR